MSARDLYCPRCGLALEWRCWSDEGTAFCEAHQARRFDPREAERDICFFRATIRRTGPESFVLLRADGVPYRPATYTDRLVAYIDFRGPVRVADAIRALAESDHERRTGNATVAMAATSGRIDRIAPGLYDRRIAGSPK